MRFHEGVRLALHQIRTEKLKSAFSLLGVVIGVTFLIVVVSVVEGIDRYVTEDFASEVFGVNTIQVRRTPSVQVSTSAADRRERARRPVLTREEAEVVRRALSVPARVGVETHLGGAVRNTEGIRADGVQISAVSEEILDIRTLRVEDGRPFSSREAARGVNVAILGRNVAEALFPDGGAAGARIRIQGIPFRVTGVLEEQGSLLGITLDNRVLVPAASTITRLLSRPRAVGSIAVQTLDPRDLPRARDEVETALRVSRGLRPAQGSDFEVETAEDSLEVWDRIATVLFLALPGLVGISLVVGGIVIMNIMLVSVAERTREIGVRMAIGARRRDIVGQFLVEAVTLSGVGAVIGVGIGTALGWGVRTYTPLPAAAAPGWMAFGVLLGVGVGIVAGVYPALRASRLDPVVALRHE